MKKTFLIVLLIFLSIFTFKNLFFTYFQQDEWHAFGVMLADGLGYVTMNQSLAQLLFSGDRAGARLLMYLMFSGFGFNSVPFLALSLGLHFLNAFIVYKIAFKLLKDKKIAYVSLLFFLFNGISSQTYTWLGTFAGTVPNMTFLLLSLYVYLKFLFDKDKSLFVYLSLILLWLSFLFKETGFFFLMLYPVAYFIYTKNILKTLKINISFVLYGIFLVVLRINEIINPQGAAVNLVTSRNSLWGIVLNAVLYPLQGFSQLILPPNVIYPLSNLIALPARFIGIMSNTTEFDILYQLKIAPAVSIAITLIFLFFIYKAIRNKLNKRYSSIIIFSLLFVFLSFIPYFFIKKGGAYLEPRYYYVGSLGSSILLGIFLILGLRSNKVFLRIITLISFSALLYFNVTSIKEDIRFQTEAGSERKYIVKMIQRDIPHLPAKVVFYVSGDAIGYYGLEELKVPFQSGLGQTLLVIYSYNKEIPQKFLHEDSILKTQGEGFLYGILDQDYKEIDGRGFGFFWDKKQMIDAIKKNNLSLDSVRAFFYNSETQELINTTKSITEEITNE